MATPSKARGVREGEGGGLVTDEMVHIAAMAKYNADPYRRTDGSAWPWDELDLADIAELRTETRHALEAAAPLIAGRALREARGVITQYLATAEKWRYDRVVWAFAIMLGEIPENTPCPDSPADARERARRIEIEARS